MLANSKMKGSKLNRAFTLIELLAVIVILAVISLISAPIIIGIIEKVKKGAATDSVHGIVEAAKLYKAEKSLDKKDGEITLDLTGKELSYKGKRPDKGTLLINGKGNVYVLAKYGKYCIEKEYTEEKAKVVSEEKCKKVEEPKIYGIKRIINTETSTWERIEDATGLEANAQVGNTPVKNDFDTIYPWSDIISYNYDTESKKITAYYGDENFKFDGTNGEVLTKIPEFYYKRYQDDEYEYIYISKIRREGYEKSEEFSVGRYVMSGVIPNVHSRSGYVPLTNHTITEFRNYARALGEEFGQLDYHYFLLQILYLVEYADYNSQAKLGPGYTNASQTSLINSGGCDTLGMKSGSKDGTDSSSIIYRGIEDIFGNIWQLVDGINIKNNRAYICYDQSKYQIDTYDGCYKEVGYGNAPADGYISKLGYDRENSVVMLPIETSGNASAPIADYFWNPNSWEGKAIVGGRCGLGNEDGLWYWNMDGAFWDSYSLVGARLVKIE